MLFVAGCEENQVRFHPRFDLIILLSAPAGVLAERLAARTGNSFGRGPGELERILDDLQAVEPLLRKAAAHEIRTTMPLDDVVAEILRLAGILSCQPGSDQARLRASGPARSSALRAGPGNKEPAVG